MCHRDASAGGDWRVSVGVKARVVNGQQLDVVAFKIVLVVLEFANCSRYATVGVH